MFFDLNESILHAMMPTEIQNVIQLNINDLLRKNRVKSHEIQMYLLSNEIYIPKILVDRIAGVCYTIDSISKNLMKDKSDENKKRLDEFYTEKVRPLLDNLKNEFRVLLGVELDNNTVLK